MRGQKEMEGAAKTIHVGTVVNRARIDRWLRGHVIDCPEDSSRLCQRGLTAWSPARIAEAGQPQVSDFDHAIHVTKDIPRFDIPVNDPLTVGIFESPRRLKDS